METKNTVYILRSDSNQSRHYTGLTSDLEKWLKWHNAGQNVDTARHRPWTLVVAFHFGVERVARRFEKYLKSGSGRQFAERHFADIPNT
jgi:predicted GIY-YIG superfamily endonuclease